MLTEIHIDRSDLTAEPFDRRMLPDPAHLVDRLFSIKRTEQLANADLETVRVVFEGRRYAIRTKEVFPEVVHLGMVDAGSIVEPLH